MKGSTLALIMAMTGRAPFCDQLEGDGVAALRDRGTEADPEDRGGDGGR